MKLAELHVMLYIRKLFGVSICFAFLLGRCPKEVIYLLIWENKEKGRDNKTL